MRRKPKSAVAASFAGDYRADRVPDHESGVEMYTLIAQTLNPFVDCYLAETLSSSSEAKMALLGVHRSRDVRTSSKREDLCNVFEKLISFSAHLTGIKLQAILFNCSQPEAICKALKELHENDHTRAILREQGVLLGAYAIALRSSRMIGSRGVQRTTSHTHRFSCGEIYTFILQWIELGVELVGVAVVLDPSISQWPSQGGVFGFRWNSKLTEVNLHLEGDKSNIFFESQSASNICHFPDSLHCIQKQYARKHCTIMLEPSQHQVMPTRTDCKCAAMSSK
ncbi:putative Homocysteine-binding domain-containing protein [Plasmopara halstedii]